MKTPESPRPSRMSHPVPRPRRPTVRPLDPRLAEECPEEQGLWYETPGEIEAGLEWGRQKALLMQWVRRQMSRRLNKRERQALVLYYLRQRSYREVGAELGVSPSHAYRLVGEAVEKLRRAAAIDGINLDSFTEP